MAIIGYARVSTVDQNPRLQLDALNEAGAKRVFTDHGVSGSTACRPQLDACLDHLREGDVLTVWKLDRLGRNTQHVLAVVDRLTSRRIGFRSLTEGLHTEGPMGKAMLTIMAAFAQLERDTMIERTRAGLAAAAANGRKGAVPKRRDAWHYARRRSRRRSPSSPPRPSRPARPHKPLLPLSSSSSPATSVSGWSATPATDRGKPVPLNMIVPADHAPAIGAWGRALLLRRKTRPGHRPAVAGPAIRSGELR